MEDLKIIRSAGYLLFILVLDGCGVSWLTSRETNPVIEDYASPIPIITDPDRHISSFSTTASRRMVIFVPRKSNINTCAEPSPDVGEAFASAIAAGLAGKLTTETNISAELATEYANAIATKITPLVYRTQGLQLFRDSVHSLCIDRMNGWITDDSYKNSTLDRFQKAAFLIEKEIPMMGQVMQKYYETSGNNKIDLDKLINTLQKLKSINNHDTSLKPDTTKDGR